MRWCQQQQNLDTESTVDSWLWVEQGGCSVQNAAPKRSCRAAEVPRALERTSRSRSYSGHTALSRTCSSRINQAVRMQSAAIPAVYAGARQWGTGQGGSVFAAAGLGGCLIDVACSLPAVIPQPSDLVDHLLATLLTMKDNLQAWRKECRLDLSGTTGDTTWTRA